MTSIETSNKLKTKLNSIWVLWYHSPDDDSWSIDSYNQICVFDTIEDFWILHNKINPIHIQYGMFFIMRKNIDPIWEDSKNKDGGCWSFKLSKKDTYKAWIELGIALISETINIDNEQFMSINGISISPKKNFSILKIWNGNKNDSDNKIINNNIPHMDISSAIYKPHISDETESNDLIDPSN